MCPSCGSFTKRRAAALCAACERTLVPAPTVRLPSGLLVRAAFRHEGAARRLVHRLKYQALASAADALARHMTNIVDDGVAVLVPMPRAALRRGRYGIDPAEALAAALSTATGIPVASPLSPGWWWPRHAKRGRQRSAPRFVRSGDVPLEGVALVDDVVTTGATAAAAAAALGGVQLVLAATIGGKGAGASSPYPGCSPGPKPE